MPEIPLETLRPVRKRPAGASPFPQSSGPESHDVKIESVLKQDLADR